MRLTELLAAMRSLSLAAPSELGLLPSSSGVYTAWLEGEECCLYVGQSSNLVKRIRSHFSGQRGGDQFCLYVYDRYIHPIRSDNLTTGEVNRLTAEWIRQWVRFRWVAVPSPELAALEMGLRRALRPILNPA